MPPLSLILILILASLPMLPVQLAQDCASADKPIVLRSHGRLCCPRPGRSGSRAPVRLSWPIAVSAESGPWNAHAPAKFSPAVQG